MNIPRENKVEKSKYNTTNSGSSIDRGYVGHKSAKMMKRAKVIEQRIESELEQKANLLNNIDKNETLKITHLIPLTSLEAEIKLENQ